MTRRGAATGNHSVVSSPHSGEEPHWQLQEAEQSDHGGLACLRVHRCLRICASCAVACVSLESSRACKNALWQVGSLAGLPSVECSSFVSREHHALQTVIVSLRLRIECATNILESTPGAHTYPSPSYELVVILTFHWMTEALQHQGRSVKRHSKVLDSPDFTEFSRGLSGRLSRAEET